MTRRTMLTALASAALVPNSRLLAATPPTAKAETPAPDPDLAATITALERASWDAFKACDAKSWGALYADAFFEMLADATFWTKEQVLDDIRSRAWETHHYTMSEIRVVPMNDSAAFITYKIDASFTWHTKDEATGKPVDKPYTTNAYATCVYAKVDECWQGFIYQETGVPTPAVPPA
ncbi:MAG: nuclear transport factor 2 family protein [Opitutaceae bacterium]|nr:nuclear transport factor 2 family protein [Opitutaceae bacterium]